MKITDKEVIKELKRVRSGDLEERLDDYPEDERDGRSDMQMLADEAGYLYSLFGEVGNTYQEDLKEARKILRETKNGKEIPLHVPSMRPVYSQHKITDCIELVSEYRRLDNLLKRLAKKGYQSKWL